VASLLRLRPNGLLELAAYRSDHVLGADWTQPGDAGLVGRCLQERTPVLIPDVKAEPEFRGCGLDVRSELDVPILIGDRAWGAINLEGRETDAFDAEDVRVLEGVAALLASSLGAVGAS
jgi:putative methionine-R-sulfoxide reductase with GAF domain